MKDYENREELIRDHWRRYGGAWDVKRIGPRYKMAVRHKLYPLLPTALEEKVLAVPMLDTLEFSFERGTLDGRPAYRIICEGIVVEERQL